MIPKEKLPKTNFDLDDVQAKLGCERKELVDTVKRLQDMGEGRFIIGRRGAKSRFQWKGQGPELVETEPQEIESETETPKTPQPFKLALRNPVSSETKQESKSAEEEKPTPSYSKKERDPFLVIRDLRESIGEVKPIDVASSVEILQTIANITGFKGTLSFDALKQYLDKQTQELMKLKAGAVWDEPVGIERVPFEWIAETGWGFWRPEQREAIARELRAWRKNK